MSTLVQRLHEQIVGRITFPLTNLLYNRRRILSTYQGLLATERLPPERLRELQLQKLRRVLISANRRVPFYRDRFARAGLVPEDIRSLSDLAAIPTLTREEVIEHLPRLIDRRRLPEFEQAAAWNRRSQPIPLSLLRRRRLVRTPTSGSTGQPVVTFEDGSVSALSWATDLRHRHWFGVGPGAREVRLTRRATEKPPPTLTAWGRQLLWNQRVLPGFNLVDDDHSRNVATLARVQPEVIWGGSTSLELLANFIHQRGRALPCVPQLVMTWSEPLLPHQKALLEDTFRCRVANNYGSRELGHLAATCPEGTLHAHQEFFLLETTAPYSEDCPGELIVTMLLETPMPLIRYHTGDLAELGTGPCGCGRTLETIRKLAGRTLARFVTREGRVFSGAGWPTMFSEDPNCGGVRRFQTVYRPDGSLCFRIVRGAGYSPKTEDFIRDYIRRNVQSDLKVEFEFPDDIRPEPSGKFPLLVDERG